MSSTIPTPEKWYEKYAWILLFLVTLLLLLIGSSGEEGPVGNGSVLNAFFTSDVTESIFELRFRGSILLGMFIFGLAILLKPFRSGERWAWYVLWYWPVFFVIHILAFGTVMPDSVFAAVSALALLLPYRKFFPKM
jgi:hypothetical protein